MVTTNGCSGRDVSKAEPTAADRLFVALDQRRIKGGPNGSVVEVLGIHVMPRGGAWVQIALAGEPAQDVVLYLPHSTTVDDAIAALNAWVETPIDDRPRLIDVMPLA